MAVVALAACSGSSASPVSSRPVAHPLAATDSHTAALSQAGLTRASLTVLSGAASVTVSAAPMPGQLLRVSTPANSQSRPQLVNARGRVQLYLAGTGQSGPAAVSVEVNSAVTWQFTFSGGASQTVLDLAHGKVDGIDFTAGSNLIDLTLPRPYRTVTITLAGGASQVSLAAPAGVPSRLQLFGGASLVRLAGSNYTGLAGGTVLAAPGWSSAANRYDVLAPAGVSMLTVSPIR